MPLSDMTLDEPPGAGAGASPLPPKLAPLLLLPGLPSAFGLGAFALGLLLPLLLLYPLLLVEIGTLAEVLPPLLLAVGADAELVGVRVAGAGAGALSKALGLDGEGAGAEPVEPAPVGGVRGTTEVLPGVVPGEAGGTGTSLCRHHQTSQNKFKADHKHRPAQCYHSHEAILID